MGGLASGNQGSQVVLSNQAAGQPVTLTVGGNGADTGFMGQITGSGSVIKVGTGTLTLDQGSNYTGGLTLVQGEVASTANPLWAVT